MGNLFVLWDPDDDPRGNCQHIAGRGISQEEVEGVLERPLRRKVSRSSGRPIAFGYTAAGRLIAVVSDEVERGLVYPVTAFEVEP